MENWQRILAESTTIEWCGDLDDDCTALWAGLMLRAELMEADHWWWCVYDKELPENANQVRSSNDDSSMQCLTGKEARSAAELAAKRYLGMQI